MNTGFIQKPPVPLTNVHAPPVFPVECLPPVLRDYVSFIAETVQVSPDMPASLALSVLSVCLQGKAKVMFSPFWTEEINLYIMVVAPPGERKSAVFSALTYPIYRFVNEHNQLHRDEICGYANAKRLLDNKLRTAIDKCEDMSIINGIQSEINALEPKRELKMITSDVTAEALASLMEENGGRMGIMCPEGGIFDVISGLYSSGGVNINIFLSGYDGEPIRIDRKYGSTYLERPLLTFGICAQPKVLNSIISNQQFSGKGLTPRFLFCQPESTIGHRKLVQDYRGGEAIKSGYCDLIRQLLEIPAEADRTLDITVAAADVLEQFADKLELQMSEKGTLADYTEFFGKLAGKALRISALFHIAEHGMSGCIDDKAMSSAVQIATYFGKHYLKMMCAERYDDTPQQILDRIIAKAQRDNSPVVSLRDIKRTARKFSEEQITDALDTLTEHNYLTVIPPNKAGRKKESYQINPLIFK